MTLLGGVGPNGAKQLLVTSFKSPQREQSIRLAGVPADGTARVWRLDASTKSGLKEEQVAYSDSVLHLKTAGSTVLLVRF